MTAAGLGAVIPDARQPAVARALRTAFGVETFDDIRPLTAGLSSALVFRLVVGGTPYLLRVITRTDAMADPTNQYANMRAGEAAGLAPRVWYTSVEDRVAITGFVEAQPMTAADARGRLPGVLRTLHALPPFPRPSVGNYFDGLDRYLGRLAKGLPEAAAAELSAIYGRVAPLYPRHDESTWVSSHNDLKAENVLFDGHRVWLVDWEAAFLNDRYVDLAVVANFAVDTEAEEAAFLEGYFGEPAGGNRLARFVVMRPLMHGLYAMMFLSLAAAAGQPIDLAEAPPDFRAFHDDMLAGRIDLADAGAKRQYGLVHLQALRQQVEAPRLRDAVRVLGSR